MKEHTLLTKLVIEFKESGDEKLLKEIQKQAYALIRTIYNYYCIYNLPLIEREDILADAQTLLLLKAIKTYDPSKSAFATHLTWSAKSFIRSRKLFYLRRLALNSASSLNALVNEDFEFIDLFFNSSFDYKQLEQTKRDLAEIFS